jgi:hypothetical protein
MGKAAQTLGKRGQRMMIGSIEMSGKRLTLKSAALAATMLITLSACSQSPSGAAQARINAMQPHIGPCAAALAKSDIAAARAGCVALVVIADGA